MTKKELITEQWYNKITRRNNMKNIFKRKVKTKTTKTGYCKKHNSHWTAFWMPCNFCMFEAEQKKYVT